MLIFLDIDGVMVPAAGWKSPQFLEDGFAAFSQKAIHALRDILSVNDTVILTTSHKSNYTLKEWKSIFSNRGIEIPRLERLENNTSNLNRREEILRWFNMNDCTQDFIIIDDDKSLNDLPRFLKERLVLTHSLIGLSQDSIKDIKAIKNKSFQIYA